MIAIYECTDSKYSLITNVRVCVHVRVCYIFRNVTDGEIRNCIDEYLDSLTNAISEKEFIIDYHQFYPVNLDLEAISKLYPEMYPFFKRISQYCCIYEIYIILIYSLHMMISDMIKCNYISKSLYASIGDVETSENTYLGNVTVSNRCIIM